MEDPKHLLESGLADVKKTVTKIPIHGFSSITQLFQATLDKDKSKDASETYNETKKILRDLKQILEKEYPGKLIGSKIKQMKQTNQDRPLTEEERKLKRYMEIAAERCFLIIRVLYKIGTSKRRLKSFSSGFDKYSYSNFYRTICENTPKLFSDTAYLMTEFSIDKDHLELKTCSDDKMKKALNDDLKYLHSLKSKVLSSEFALGDLLNVVYRFEKKSKFKGFAKRIKKTFLYSENGGGFTLRNDIAHDKKFLDEIDKEYVLGQLSVVNAFNMAILEVFYFDYFGKWLNLQDTKQARNLLSSIK